MARDLMGLPNIVAALPTPYVTRLVGWIEAHVLQAFERLPVENLWPPRFQPSANPRQLAHALAVRWAA